LLFSTTATSYNNWDKGDPNNGGRLQNEDCALIKPDGKWNDYPCEDKFNYICKNKPGTSIYLFISVHVYQNTPNSAC
jgi:Lectin C-type domain.